MKLKDDPNVQELMKKATGAGVKTAVGDIKREVRAICAERSGDLKTAGNPGGAKAIMALQKDLLARIDGAMVVGV